MAQRQYVALNEINFEELSRCICRLISSHDVDTWLNEQQLAVYEGFELEMIMRARKTTVEEVLPGLRWEIVSRIFVAVE